MVFDGLRGLPVIGDDDGVTVRPRRPCQDQVRQPQIGAGLSRIGGDGGGERVRGVDNGGDLVVLQVVSQALDAAEAADPHRADR